MRSPSREGSDARKRLALPAALRSASAPPPRPASLAGGAAARDARRRPAGGRRGRRTSRRPRAAADLGAGPRLRRPPLARGGRTRAVPPPRARARRRRAHGPPAGAGRRSAEPGRPGRPYGQAPACPGALPGGAGRGTRRPEPTEHRAGRGGADQLAVGRALESIGGTYEDLGDWDRAADWYGRALELHQNKDDAGGGGPAARAAGLGARQCRPLRRRAARVACRRRELPEAGGRGSARTRAERGRQSAGARGQAKESVRICRSALDAAREAGDERLQAALLLRLADACDRIGDVRTGRKHRRAADELLGIHG